MLNFLCDRRDCAHAKDTFHPTPYNSWNPSSCRNPNKQIKMLKFRDVCPFKVIVSTHAFE